MYDLARVHALKQLIDDTGAAYGSGFFAPEAHLNMTIVLN